MARRTCIGVMGGTSADAVTAAKAEELGRLIAREGWTMITGGRPTGVMQASVTGAHAEGGLTIGVLYGEDRDDAAEGLDIVIPSGMGAGRNVINVLASDVVVACRGTGGTLSEIAMALRFGRPVVLLDFDPGEAFLKATTAEPQYALETEPAAAIARVREFLTALDRA